MESHQRQHVHALMLRLADGDRTAFDAAFSALWPVVRAFCSRLLIENADAEDAAQNALLKVFANSARFDGERDALTWVLGIAAYECKTARKKVQRRREDPTSRDDQVTHAATPEDAAITRDLHAAALAVMGSLSHADIETLQTMLDDGPRSIAAATFRKRLQRAIERLRAAWSSRHDTD